MEFISQFMGTLIFALYLRNKEFKTLIMCSVTLQVISGIFSLIYVVDLNESMNISNQDFVQVSNLLLSCLQITMNYLPIFILFTWITPDTNETTMYVLMYSSYCFFNYSVRP
jgi:hypothetical protein